MFINEMIMAHFFTMLNLGIVVALASYVIKRYGLPVIYDLIAKKEKDEHQLAALQNVLEDEQVRLEQAIKQDQLLYENFKIKIKEWNKVVAQERRNKENEYLVHAQTLQKKHTQRDELKNKNHLKKMLSERIVSALDSSLPSYFQNELFAARYLESVVRSIDERTL